MAFAFLHLTGKTNPEPLTAQVLNYCRGGVRGIVELEILRAIEKELGGGISVQDFFDLIVGTRYCSCLSVLTNEH